MLFKFNSYGDERVPVILNFNQSFFSGNHDPTLLSEIVNQVFQENFGWGLHMIRPLFGKDVIDMDVPGESVQNKGKDFEKYFDSYFQAIVDSIGTIRRENPNVKSIVLMDIAFSESSEECIEVLGNFDEVGLQNMERFVLDTLGFILDVKTSCVREKQKSYLLKRIEQDCGVSSVKVKISPQLLREKYKNTNSSKFQICLKSLIADIQVAIEDAQ